WGAESHTQAGRAHQRVFVAKAGPCDTEFGPPIEITDPADVVEVYDLPRVAVMPSGVVHVTYLKAAPGLTSFSIVQAMSKDGVTWEGAPLIGTGSAGSYRNFARICRSDTKDRTYLAYVDQDVGGVALVSSNDQGKTWSNPSLVSTADEADLLGFYGT